LSDLSEKLNGVNKGWHADGGSPSNRKAYINYDGSFRKYNARLVPSDFARAIRATSAERKAFKESFDKLDPVSLSEEKRGQLLLEALGKDCGAEIGKVNDFVKALDALEKPKRADHSKKYEAARKSSRLDDAINSMKSLSIQDKSQ